MTDEAPKAARTRVPIGIEKVLCRAAGDAAFKEGLLTQREATLAAAGYQLRPNEAFILRSIRPDQLAAMIDRIDLKRHGQRPWMRTISAVAFAAATSVGAGCTPSPTPDAKQIQERGATEQSNPETKPSHPEDESCWGSGPIAPLPPPAPTGARPDLPPPLPPEEEEPLPEGDGAATPESTTAPEAEGTHTAEPAAPAEASDPEASAELPERVPKVGITGARAKIEF